VDGRHHVTEVSDKTCVLIHQARDHYESIRRAHTSMSRGMVAALAKPPVSSRTTGGGEGSTMSSMSNPCSPMART